MSEITDKIQEITQLYATIEVERTKLREIIVDNYNKFIRTNPIVYIVKGKLIHGIFSTFDKAKTFKKDNTYTILPQYSIDRTYIDIYLINDLNYQINKEKYFLLMEFSNNDYEDRLAYYKQSIKKLTIGYF